MFFRILHYIMQQNFEYCQYYSFPFGPVSNYYSILDFLDVSSEENLNKKKTKKNI